MACLVVCWGGGVEVRNLPQFTAFLPQFFSDASFQNIFPLRKILTLPSLSLCTLYMYVFSSVFRVICVAGRFSVFVVFNEGPFPLCGLQGSL